MLLLSNPRTITVDGVTVFPDHADPNQFWALVAPVALERRGPDKTAQFTLISYKPAAVSGGAKGGGFLMFETGLRLETATEQKILARLSSIAKKPRLTAVQFDEGTVQCIALNLQGSAGTTAENAAPGTFNAVEKILGASVPSLHGNNVAAFSLTLSQEGATILRSAFQQEGAPVGVVYNLKFTGIRPALEVRVKADMKRVYDHFSASLSGQIYFVQLGIEAGIEKLKQSGALKIEVIHFTTDADRADKEKQALQLFRDTLLKDFFTPTLTPGQLAGGIGGNTGGTNTPTIPAIPTIPGGSGSNAPGGGGIVPGGGSGAPGGGAGVPGGGQGAVPTMMRAGSNIAPFAIPADAPAPGDAAPGGGPGEAAPGGPGPEGSTPPTGDTPPPVTPAPEGTTPPGTTPPDTTTPSSPEVIGGAAPPSGDSSGGNTPTDNAPSGNPPAGNSPGANTPGANQPGAVTPTGVSPISVSFKLKFIKQEELRTATFEYKLQEAVQRTYNPQGFIGLLTQDLEKSKHFIEVDLDDPFFRQMAITVDAPIDFAKIGMRSAQIALDYGNPSDATNHRHKDMVFDAANPGEQKWEFFLNKKFDTKFAYNVQYHFDATSGWDGESLSYQMKPETSEDRTLYVNPFEHFKFQEFQVSARGIDFGVVDFTEVTLRYKSPSGWSKEKTVMLNEATAEPPVWKLRTLNDPAPTILYKCKHHLKDGKILSSPEQSTTQNIILVDDAFPDALNLVFFPFFDAATTKKVFVDLEYKDQTNRYERKERLEIPGTATDEVPLRIAIMNPVQRKFKYKVTYVKATGIKQTPPIETEETILSLAEA